jgi:lipopolysaccharide export system protein LptC
MTVDAEKMQNRRRRFASPGGAHDRLVGFLAKALPAAIGLVAAIMILSPLSPRGEIGFLLDRNEVAITKERLAVDSAMYRGEDSRGRPFRVIAGSAAQVSSDTPVVELDDLQAMLEMADGPARIEAPHGSYNYRAEVIAVEGPVVFSAGDGYRMTTQGVRVDLDAQVAEGSGGISGSVPSGTFSADRLVADLRARTIRLEGNARLRMVPGELRMPR